MNLLNKLDKKYNTILYIVCILVAVLFTIVITGCVQDANATMKVEKTGKAAIELNNLDKYVNTLDVYELQTLINSTSIKRDAAYEMEQSARTLGYIKTVEQAMTDYQYFLDANLYYQDRLQYVLDTYYSELLTKYPIATNIWIQLKAHGYNDYVCAGILGNVMAEVGGQTLNIQEKTWSSNPDYYGICQWRIKYYPGVNGLDLNGQIDYLLGNIEKVFATYGNYEEFIKLEDEKEAALTFAEVYERCGSASYNVRQTNATKALETFVIKEEIK